MGSEAEPSTSRPVPVSDPGRTDVSDHIRRLPFIRWLILASLFVLAVGLAYRQLYRSADYTACERRQSLRLAAVPAPRGAIYDREHRLLASNRPRTAAVLHLGRLRAEFREEQRSIPLRENGAAPRKDHPTGAAPRARSAVVQRYLDRINAITGRQGRLDATRLERHFANERANPYVLVDDLSPEEGARLGTELGSSGPLQLQRSINRWYPYGSLAAHVIGRVRRDMIRPEPDPSGQIRASVNFMGLVGDSGVEKQYDARLQGRPGSAIIRVDAWGDPTDPPLDRRDPVPGGDLVLSLDIDLQLAAERAMAATPGVPRGAAVAISVATGEVLVLASKPDFDLNTVSPTLAPATNLRIESEGGWLNRGIQGLYPPGSTFKIFTAIAGLRRGTLHPRDVLHCEGFYDVAGHRFPCHNPSGHGDLTLREALAQSCNVFAYQTGLAAGPDALAAEARRFHFGEPTGIDLPFETRRMLVPSPGWKQAEGRGPWTAGDTANLSIGQGDLRCSPLQAACAIASLARRETLTVPTLLHQPGRPPSGNRPPEPLGLSEGDYAALIEGLQAGILTGIGRDAQVPGLSMAGKTGTAQVARKEGMGNIAWFVAFAPIERPAIAIAVAMEGNQPGTEFAGGEYAAPIVREIAGAYLDKQARQ